MNIKEIYKLAIEIGIANDFRSKKEIQDYLKRKKDNFESLSGFEKEVFDKDKLFNPYSDTRIHFDNKKKNIKKVLVGIDVSIGALCLAKDLGIGTYINHHPIGLALAKLDETIDMQVDYLEQIGVPVNIAEKLFHKRILEVGRKINPANHYEEPDAAQLMDINLINIHTPADNLAAKFLEREINSKKPRYVEDILDILNKIPEYKEAAKKGFGPTLFSGEKNNRSGKIAISEITGGTEGSSEIYSALANAGVGTVVAMHLSEEHRKAAEKAHINVVVAGHISTDSLGMNLFLDKLEKKGIEIIPTGGLIRVSRNKKK